MQLNVVIARLRERRRILGLGSTLGWVPSEAWARTMRAVSGPVWGVAKRVRPEVADSVPGRDPDRLRAQLADVVGHDIPGMRVDGDAYMDYLTRAGYPEGCYGDPHNPTAPFHEKTLEHFVAFEMLGLEPGKMLLDVASNLSPVPDIARRLYGCDALRQDLIYRRGLEADRVGSPASRIPLKNETIDAITLHCAFEHFEGDEDSAFIKEAERLLRPGGKVCILPLYLAEKHTLVTNRLLGGPRLDDPGTEVRMRVRRRDSPFSRFYAPERLKERVLDVTGLRPRLHFVENHDVVSPHCYLKFVLVLEKA